MSKDKAKSEAENSDTVAQDTVVNPETVATDKPLPKSVEPGHVLFSGYCRFTSFCGLPGNHAIVVRGRTNPSELHLLGYREAEKQGIPGIEDLSPSKQNAADYADYWDVDLVVGKDACNAKVAEYTSAYGWRLASGQSFDETLPDNARMTRKAAKAGRSKGRTI